MARWLVAAAIALPILGGAAVWQRTSGPSAPWATAVYLAASRVCHQRPERSFATAGVQWPVCGRCAGLYLGGAIGSLVAGRALRRRVGRGRAAAWLCAAAAPTAGSLVWEWIGMGGMTTGVRAVLALPLGAALAWVVILTAADGASKTNQVN